MRGDIGCKKPALCNSKEPDLQMNLQEIEKVEDPKVLYSLLMPWEFGKSVAGLNSPFLT